MAKTVSRRRGALEDPEEVLDLLQRWLEPVKRQAKWIILGLVLVAAASGGWAISARMQAAAEERAAAALTLIKPQLTGPEAATKGRAALEKFIKESAGTKAALDAALLQANLLYQEKKYADAARVYEGLPRGRDPQWDALVGESLSYCYEGLGDFKKAAQALKPAVEQAAGPWQRAMMQRLALLYDKAQEPQEALVYWRKLSEQAPEPLFSVYLQEKIAADEAKVKK